MKQEFLGLINANLTQICVGRFSIIFNFTHPSVEISLEKDVFLDEMLVWRYGKTENVSSSIFNLIECNIQYCAIENGIFYIQTSKGKLETWLNTEGYETGTINSEGQGLIIIGK